MSKPIIVIKPFRHNTREDLDQLCNKAIDYVDEIIDKKQISFEQVYRTVYIIALKNPGKAKELYNYALKSLDDKKISADDIVREHIECVFKYVSIVCK